MTLRELEINTKIEVLEEIVDCIYYDRNDISICPNCKDDKICRKLKELYEEKRGVIYHERIRKD